MQRDRSWIAPALGILFFVLVLVGAILTGEGKDPAKDSAEEITQYYIDNESQQLWGAFLVALGMVPFLFFAGYLRRVLYRAEGTDGFLPTVAWGGAVLLAAGTTVGASLTFALADYAEDLDPVAMQAINTITYDFFFPFPIGMSILLLGAGLSAVRSGALPRWLAWIAIVVGIVCLLGPVGFAGFLLGFAWILVVSILLTRRARRAPGEPPPPAPSATAA